MAQLKKEAHKLERKHRHVVACLAATRRRQDVATDTQRNLQDLSRRQHVHASAFAAAKKHADAAFEEALNGETRAKLEARNAAFLDHSKTAERLCERTASLATAVEGRATRFETDVDRLSDGLRRLAVTNERLAKDECDAHAEADTLASRRDALRAAAPKEAAAQAAKARALTDARAEAGTLRDALHATKDARVVLSQRTRAAESAMSKIDDDDVAGLVSAREARLGRAEKELLHVQAAEDARVEALAQATQEADRVASQVGLLRDATAGADEARAERVRAAAAAAVRRVDGERRLAGVTRTVAAVDELASLRERHSTLRTERDALQAKARAQAQAMDSAQQAQAGQLAALLTEVAGCREALTAAQKIILHEAEVALAASRAEVVGGGAGGREGNDLGNEIASAASASSVEALGDPELAALASRLQAAEEKQRSIAAAYDDRLAKMQAKVKDLEDSLVQKERGETAVLAHLRSAREQAAVEEARRLNEAMAAAAAEATARRQAQEEEALAEARAAVKRKREALEAEQRLAQRKQEQQQKKQRKAARAAAEAKASKVTKVAQAAKAGKAADDKLKAKAAAKAKSAAVQLALTKALAEKREKTERKELRQHEKGVHEVQERMDEPQRQQRHSKNNKTKNKNKKKSSSSSSSADHVSFAEDAENTQNKSWRRTGGVDGTDNGGEKHKRRRQPALTRKKASSSSLSTTSVPLGAFEMESSSDGGLSAYGATQPFGGAPKASCSGYNGRGGGGGDALKKRDKKRHKSKQVNRSARSAAAAPVAVDDPFAFSDSSGNEEDDVFAKLEAKKKAKLAAKKAKKKKKKAGSRSRAKRR